MRSTMMDIPLSLNHLLERAGTYFGGNVIVSPARQVAAHAPMPSTTAGHARSRRRCSGWACSRGERVADAVLEPPCAPGVLLRHPGRGRR